MAPAAVPQITQVLPVKTIAQAVAMEREHALEAGTVFSTFVFDETRQVAMDEGQSGEIKDFRSHCRPSKALKYLDV